jgi:CheY-like chemotaxis protein/HPt (histidine-containing phosphotransfer) domain-containing protein
MSRPLDVLVVEDNPVNQKVVVALLSKWGHRTVVAGDGARGLEALERQAFDLVLMDIQMPVMDGIAATCSIRAREHGHGGHIPIIAITAHAATQDRDRCLAAGADRYLTKPLNSELLRQTIAELLPEAAGAGAGEPAVPAAAEGIAGPVDFEQLRGFVGDDAGLQAEVIQIFLDDAPQTLDKAARAITDADPRALEMTAHRIKGSLATLGSVAAAETACLLEAMGRNGLLDGAAELCERLRREVDATAECLRLWQARPAACPDQVSRTG